MLQMERLVLHIPFVNYELKLTIRYLLRRHDESVLEHIQPDRSHDGGNRLQECVVCENEGKGDNMTEHNATRPEDLLITAMANLMGSAGGHFAGMRNTKVT